jgi:hypothetical protein
MCEIFNKGILLGDISFPRQGLASADNNRFLRLWWEVKKSHIDFDCQSVLDSEKSGKKWFPHNKGGAYRKWYGNRGYIINWENNGKELREFKKSVIRNPNNYFKKSIGYSDVTSGDFSIRYYGAGFVFDSTGPSFFNDSDVDDLYIMAVLNSVVAKAVLKIFCPSLHYTQSAVAKTPIIIDDNSYVQVIELAKKCIEIAQEDWDNKEISWDFRTNIFIKLKQNEVFMENIWDKCKEYSMMQRKLLKMYEEQINEILIKIYGLSEELNPNVSEEALSVKIPDVTEMVKEFISYVVGCIFGRYSIYNHKQGFKTEDILLISDSDYFENDIVNKFIKYIEYLFGEESIQDNLKFICESMNLKGNTYSESLRTYFQKEFYKNHCKMYSNVNSGRRPIYWLFDSGKQNGFKALIYMHRYDRDTVGRIRSDYLHKTQNAIEGALKNTEYIISTSTSAVDKAKATKDRDKYIKQLSEIRIYDQALAHVALQRIDIDLDDGVKHNYELFQGIEVANEGTKKQTIDLLAKI